jgi:hypothetical protein
MRYDVAGIGRNTVGLPYRLFSDWPRKSDSFLNFPHCSSRLSRTVHLGFPTLFIWAGPLSFFLLIQRAGRGGEEDEEGACCFAGLHDAVATVAVVRRCQNLSEFNVRSRGEVMVGLVTLVTSVSAMVGIHRLFE